ncbi:Transposon Ty3-G Gag-Pol poly [Labeo rohita]|uniref:Transposon Ty3-G Gag-Pol poly n=1 Tax=Labeo rohita TaxID=84645 RepID=A0A498LUP6_LABRO|nr:Transposon Ty3-G Gag-Pol poly [Labeo rohita]
MYPKLCQGLGMVRQPYTIKLKPNVTPFSLATPRRVPLPLLGKVKKELERMEQLGVITKVEEPTDWCSGMVPVLKKNGAVRIYVDLTKLNEAVCREKLRFSPRAFSEMHVDGHDVLIWGESQAQHDERLHTVLARIEKAGITFNLEKCELGRQEVKFLGHIIAESGVRPDPDKTRAVLQMKEPGTVSEVRSFLGMVNQLGKFIPCLAEKDRPLRDLLSKRNHWGWGKAQQEAFSELKRELSSTPVLALYNPNKELKLSADTSSYGLGAVLLQKEEEQWKPVVYASRSLTPTEQRYAQVEKEALGLTWGCERFKDFLIGHHFHLETDHKPLVSLLSIQELAELPPRIQRFRMRLMSQTFANFAADYGFSHVTSSPRFAQSNGEAECHIQTVKHLLGKAKDPYLAMLAYRTTPLPNGYSPAQLLMGRRLRTPIPQHHLLLIPSLPDYTTVAAKEKGIREKQAANFNTRHRARQLSHLTSGQRVWITDTKTEGTVLASHSAPRSYLVESPQGTIRRNRRHLVPMQNTE